MTVSAVPAQAGTTNWLRACKSTHTVHITRSCTITPPVGTRVLKYRDSAGQEHHIHHASSAWTWARHHSVPCRTMASVSCYGHDDLTGSRVIVYRSGLHIVLASLR